MSVWTNSRQCGPRVLESTGLLVVSEPGNATSQRGRETDRSAGEIVGRFYQRGSSAERSSLRPAAQAGRTKASSRRGTIHVVDADPEARETVLLLLGGAGHDVVFYDDGQALFTATLGPRSCILFELGADCSEGLRLLPRLRLHHTGVPVIAMAFRPGIPTAVAALKRGACEFVEKPFSRHPFLAAVERALERRRPAPGSAIERAVRAHMTLARLSPLELDVLSGLASGATSRELAEAAGLSPHAVDMYRAGILRKLDVCHLSDALRVTYDAGLVPDRRQA
jgi:two-component system response regulator FixJ